MIPTNIEFNQRIMTLDEISFRVDAEIIKLKNKYIIDNKFEDDTKVIISILLRIPLPPLFFKEEDNVLYPLYGEEIIKSIHKFRNDEFPITNPVYFSEFHGKYFSGLVPSIKRRLMEYQFTVYIISNNISKEMEKDLINRINFLYKGGI